MLSEAKGNAWLLWCYHTPSKAGATQNGDFWERIPNSGQILTISNDLLPAHVYGKQILTTWPKSHSVLSGAPAEPTKNPMRIQAFYVMFYYALARSSARRISVVTVAVAIVCSLSGLRSFRMTLSRQESRTIVIANICGPRIGFRG